MWCATTNTCYSKVSYTREKYVRYTVVLGNISRMPQKLFPFRISTVFGVAKPNVIDLLLLFVVPWERIEMNHSSAKRIKSNKLENKKCQEICKRTEWSECYMVKSYIKPSIEKYTRSNRYLDASLSFCVKYLTNSLLEIVHEICEILSHYPVTIQKIYRKKDWNIGEQRKRNVVHNTDSIGP